MVGVIPSTPSSAHTVGCMASEQATPCGGKERYNLARGLASPQTSFSKSVSMTGRIVVRSNCIRVILFNSLFRLLTRETVYKFY